MDILGLKRYCCRRMLMTHIEIIDKIMMYAQILTPEITIDGGDY